MECPWTRSGRSVNPTPAGSGRPAAPVLRTALLLGALIALAPLSIDLYLPALPAITADLNTSASSVQLTLTAMLVGLGFGQLMIGPLSDVWGRRRPLFAGLALYAVASLLVVVTPDVGVLSVLRFLQGMGGAAGTVVAVAVVSDLFEGRAAARLLARLMLVMGVSPVLAPSLGSQLMVLTSWRGVFGLLALLALALLLLVVRGLPETLPVQHRLAPGFRSAVNGYVGLLGDRVLIGWILVSGLALGVVFGFVSGAAFVFQGQFGLDPREFGLLFGLAAVFLIAGSQLAALLLHWWEPLPLLTAALLGGGVAAVAMLALAMTGTGGLAGVVAPLWVVLLACGLAVPNGTALAVSRRPDAAGTTAALLGAAQSAVGALVSPFVGLLGNDAVALASVVFTLLCLTLVVLGAVARSTRGAAAVTAAQA